MKLKPPKILYFTAGAAPTKEDRAAVEKLGVTVQFRNAQHIYPGDGVEPCNGVAGVVPKQYKDKKIPSAEAAVKQYLIGLQKHESQLKALDTPAPGQTAPNGQSAGGTGDAPATSPPGMPEGWAKGN